MKEEVHKLDKEDDTAVAGPIVNTPTVPAAASAQYSQAVLRAAAQAHQQWRLGCAILSASCLGDRRLSRSGRGPNMSSDAVSLLLSQDRGSILRVADLPIQLDRHRDSEGGEAARLASQADASGGLTLIKTSTSLLSSSRFNSIGPPSLLRCPSAFGISTSGAGCSPAGRYRTQQTCPRMLISCRCC